MSACVGIELQCDCCGEHSSLVPGVVEYVPNGRYVAKFLKVVRKRCATSGWTVNVEKDGILQDFCPRCDSYVDAND